MSQKLSFNQMLDSSMYVELSDRKAESLQGGLSFVTKIEALTIKQKRL